MYPSALVDHGERCAPCSSEEEPGGLADPVVPGEALVLRADRRTGGEYDERAGDEAAEALQTFRW
jgi:hypothetical protein